MSRTTSSVLQLIKKMSLAAALTPSLALAATLTDVSHNELGQNQLELRLTLDEPASLPKHFSINEPARIAVDMADTSSGLSRRLIDINSGVVRNVMIAEAGERTRAVINLDASTPYSIRTEGNDIVIVMRAAGAAAMQTATTHPAAASQVDDVDFRRGEGGEGRVIIRLSDTGAPMDIRDEARRIVVDLPATRLPEAFIRRLDVMDFGTPVKNIDAKPLNGGTRFVITPTGEYEQLAYQADDVLTIEVKRPVKDEIVSGEPRKKKYTGERLTLKFQDIEVRPLLQLIADFTGMNIVVSDSVQGSMSLRLENVPWDQALDIILTSRGLSMRQEGNVMMIAPTAEFAAKDKQELDAKKQAQALDPLYSEFIQVNYAKASDLATIIQGDGSKFLSERGSLTLDTRTNTLLIRDTAEKVEEVRQLVRKLDIPVKQVLIESRIVIATTEFSREIGSRFGVSYVTDNGSDGIITTTGSLEGTDTTVGSALDNLSNTGTPFPVELGTLQNRLNTNRSVTGAMGSLALSILGSDSLVDLEISALQAEGEGELVSNPRVITSNSQPARIEQGVEIPYQEASSSGATSVSFKKAVLAVEVTPQITPDNKVIMDINVSKDQVGEIFNGVPSINTREVETQVLVGNGETVVLGGIYEIEKRNQQDKVPGLGDIPVLGRLFKYNLDTSDKAELLIFVTPKIISQPQSVNIQ